MGKYTSLAQKISEEELIKPSSPVVHPPSEDTARTPLRPNAVNAVIRCIHRLTEDSCAVCSGYVRWLIANERSLRHAQANPEATRREYVEM